MFRRIFSTEGLSWAFRMRSIIVAIGVILYVLSPLDILPESVLGIIGLFDDFFVVLSSALYFVISFRQSLANA